MLLRAGGVELLRPALLDLMERAYCPEAKPNFDRADDPEYWGKSYEAYEAYLKNLVAKSTGE